MAIQPLGARPIASASPRAHEATPSPQAALPTARGWAPGARAGTASTAARSPLAISVPSDFNRYAPQTARGAAELSKLVYGPPAEVQARLTAAGYSKAEFISDPLTGTQLVVAFRNDAVVVAFRGTEADGSATRTKLGAVLHSINDIGTDLSGGSGLDSVPRFGGAMHTGFMRAYGGVDQRLQDAVRRAQGGDPDKPILFTGHSLGGALAQIAATDLKEKGFNVASVYTFGQPRVGDRAFSAHYRALGLSSKTYRHVNQGDPVPRLPKIKLDTILGNIVRWVKGEEADRFRHGGNMVYFDQNRVRTMNPPDAKLDELTTGDIVSRRGIDQAAGNAPHHAMDAYLEMVKG